MGRISTKNKEKLDAVIVNQFGKPLKKGEDKTKGAFSIPAMNDQRWGYLFKRLALEVGRLKVLRDMDVMLNSFMEGPAKYFISWLSESMPNVTFGGNLKVRAQEIYENLIERTAYEKLRGQFLYNAIFREEFILTEIDFDDEILGYLKTEKLDRVLKLVRQGRIMGHITGLRHLPPEHTYKWFDLNDRPINSARAYFQIGENYLGFPGDEPPENAKFIPHINVIHPRWNNLRHGNIWYSRPEFTSLREQFNRSQLMLEDSVLDSHFSMAPILVFTINAMGREAGASEEQIRKFKEELVGIDGEGWEQVLTAGSMLFLSGTDDVKTVNDNRMYSIRKEDILVQLDLLFMCSRFPAYLAGYQGKGSLNGETLDIMKKHTELMIREANRFEWWEILRPIIERELMLHGIVGVKMKADFPETSFDSQTIREKINESKIASYRLSRKSAFEGRTFPTFDEEFEQVIKEHKMLKEAGVDPTKYREDDPQDLNKQAKGSPRDGAETPITKQEGSGDARKDEQNMEQK